MANLELIGAVGVKVRPDARGFRREAKDEIMSQLGDLEGDVNVNPNVKYNKADVRRAMDRAFKDVTITQDIYVKPKVRDSDFRAEVRKALKTGSQAIVSPTPIRITADTKAATDAIAAMSEELDDVNGNLERMPKSLDEIEDNYKNTFTGIQEKLKQAKKDQVEYTKSLTETTEKLDEQKTVVADLAATEKRERRDVNALQKKIDKETSAIEAHRLAYHNVIGRELKKEQSELRKAAEERKKLLVAEMKEKSKVYDLAKQELDASKDLGAELKVQLRDLEKKNKANEKLITEQTEYEKTRRANYEQEKKDLEDSIKLQEEKQKELQETIRQETLAQNARARSNKSLRQEYDAAGDGLREYMRLQQEGMDWQGTYFEWRRRKELDLSDQQIADLKEYEQRFKEHAEYRKKVYEAERKLTRELNANENPGWAADAQASLFDIDREQQKVEQWANQAKAYIEKTDPRIKTTPYLDPAALTTMNAAMAYATRPRDVYVRPRFVRSNLQLSDEFDTRMEFPIDLRLGNTKKFAQEVAEAFSGVGIARTIGKEFRNAMKDFDQLAIGAASTALKLGLITSASTTAAGGIATLTTDISELSAILLMTPAVLTQLASMIYTSAKGFDQFGAAVDGDEEALASFGAEGKRAARILGDLKEELNEDVKDAFWDGLGSSLGDMADAINGPVLDGLTEAAEQTGKVWAGVFRSMEKFAESGKMEEAFDAMNEGIDELSNSTEPLFDALNEIGLVGSKYLPRLGRWATEGAESFRDWAEAASENGDMDMWIERSITHMKNLGSITSDTMGTIQGLSKAATAAGIGGLAAWAVAMDKINAAANGEFFQTHMADIFEGGLNAMTSFTRGLGAVGRATLEQSDFIEDALESMGLVSENVLTSMAQSFNNPRLLGGFREMFSDLEEASGGLEPVFDKIANGLGDGARLFGEMAKGALNIADAFLTVWDNSENLTGALEKLIPFLTDYVASMIEITHIPITAAMDGLAGLINMFLGLPGAMQGGLATLAAAALLGPKLGQLGRWYTGMTTAFQKGEGKLGGAAMAWRNAMQSYSNGGRVFIENTKMLTANQRAIARMGGDWRDTVNHLSNARAQMGLVNDQLKGMASQLKPVTAGVDRLRQRQQALTQAFMNGPQDMRAVADYANAYRKLSGEIARTETSYRAMAAAALSSGREAGKNLASSMRTGLVNGLRTMGPEVAGHFAQQGQRAGVAMTDGVARAFKQFSLADALDPSRLITPHFNQAVADIRSQLQDLTTYARAAGTTAGANVRDGLANAASRVGNVFAPIGQSLQRTISDAMRAVSSGLASEQGSFGHLGWVFKNSFETIEKDAQESGRRAGQNLTAGTTDGVRQTAQRIGAAFSGAQSGISQAVRNMTTAFSGGFQNIATNARVGMAMVNAQLASVKSAPAVTALGQVAKAAGTAGQALGGAGASGLRMGATGLLEVLGGPWGLVLAGAGAALVTFGQRAADQRQKIQDLQGTLDEFGNTTADTMNAVADDLNTARVDFEDFDLRRIIGDGPETVGASLSALGMTSKEVADMMANDKGAYMDLATAMSDLGEGIVPSEEALQRLSSMTGVSTDALRQMAPFLGDAGDKMLAMSGNIDGATDSFTNLHGEVTPASAKTQELAEALSVIADEAAPAAEKVDALNEALARMNGEEITADKAVADMHEAIRKTSEELPGFVEQYQNFTDAIDDSTGKIDLNTPAGYALGDMLEGLGNKAKEAGFKTGDMAGELQTARDGFIQSARDAGLPKEAIDQLGAAWDSYVGTPAEVEKTVKLSGAAEAMKEADSLLQTLGLEYDQKRFEAWLEADPENAKLAAEDAKGAARAFADDEYLGNFGIEKGDFDVAMGEIESRGLEWDAAKFTAWLTADPENAKLAAEDSQAAARKFADDTYGARMTADGTDVNVKLDEINAKLERASVPRHLVFALTGNADNFNAVMDAAKAKGAEITNPDAFKAFLTANADQFMEKKMTVDQILETWTGLPHDVRVNGVTEDAMWKLEEVDGKLKLVDATPATARVASEGALAAALEIGQVKLALDGANGTATATVTAVDNASTIIAVPKSQAEMYQRDYNGTVLATDSASSVISVPKAMAEAFANDPKNANITATDGASHVITVPKSMAEHFVKTYNGTITSSDAASATIAIPQGSANRFVKDYNGNMTSSDAASGTIDGVQGKANDYTGDYNATVSASDNGASGFLGGIIEMLNNIRNGATAVINVLRGGENADGGIWNSVGGKFANGGFVPAMPMVQRFASGGFTDREMRLIRSSYTNPVKENHRAQIAKPVTPFRIWSEPETGGESYIPLSVSKRARSTAIWEETGNRLGVNWEKYADGGVRGGNSSSSSAANYAPSRTSGRVQNIQVVNHYPQAEPTSVTVNRSLQFAANL